MEGYLRQGQENWEKGSCGVFEICVEKGRTVFQGNNVKDENSDFAYSQTLGSSPATMEAGKAVDAYGAGVQAYTQALMQVVETWVDTSWPMARQIHQAGSAA